MDDLKTISPDCPQIPKLRPISVLKPMEGNECDSIVRAHTLASPAASYSGNSSSSSTEEPSMSQRPSSEKPHEIPLQRELLLDRFGLPLEPQPLLNDPGDPLTWRQRDKIKILIIVSLISSLSQFLAFSISSAMWHLHKYLNVPVFDISYVVGLYILFLGIGPFFWNPLAHAFGRRPLFIASLIGTIATAAGSGLSRSYASILIFRALNGFFAAIPIGLGSVVVCDLFYQHERGFFMGLYMLVQINGGHLSPIIGGYIQKLINWRWCFHVASIMGVLLFAVLVFHTPETLYSRAIESRSRPQMNIYQQELIRKMRQDNRKLRLGDFMKPFRMLRYPSVVLPSIFYAVAAGYGSMLFFISSAIIFHHVYHFRSYQTGLLLGIPLTIGSLIGEFGAGGFSDWVTERRAIRRGGKRISEDRLYAMLPGVILTPLGLIVEGLSIYHQAHWIGPGLGIGMASAGLQIITTVTYAYTAECYPRQAAETGAILNFGRQIFSFGVGFYAIAFAWRDSIQNAWLLFALLQLICFIPMLVLMWKGSEWREYLGGPDWNMDL